jgi:RNA polymerase sigma factor (sigma-70 family)
MPDITTKGFASLNGDVEEEIESSRLKDIPEKYKKDFALVQEIIKGSEEAWQVFVLKTQDFLYYTIRKVINKTNFDYKTKQKALELSEDLFLEFYEHLLKNDTHLFKMYKGNSKLSSYIYVCLSNFIYDFFKSKRWKHHISEISVSELGDYIEKEGELTIAEIVDKFSDKGSDTFNPEKELFKKEISSILDNLVSTLNEKDRLCFDLLFVDGLKPSEVALILGSTSVEVSQTKYKIKERRSGKTSGIFRRTII